MIQRFLRFYHKHFRTLNITYNETLAHLLYNEIEVPQANQEGGKRDWYKFIQRTNLNHQILSITKVETVAS